MDSSNQCCGKEFEFDLNGLDQYKFYAAGESTIIVAYIKDGQVYTTVSYDCGQNFSEPKKTMSINGVVKDIQVQAKNNQFVIAFKETISDIEYRRAIAGSLAPTEKTINSRECTTERPKGKKLVDLSVGFREKDGKEESVDHEFYLTDDGKIGLECYGHG